MTNNFTQGGLPMNSKTNISNIPTLFIDLANEWLLNKSYKIKESTFLKYQNIIDNYISLYFDNIALTELSTSMLEKIMRNLYEDTKNNLSYNTYKGIFYVIKSIVTYGIQSEYITHIFVTFSITDNNNTEEIQTLDEDQEYKLVNHLQRNRTSNSLGILISFIQV